MTAPPPRPIPARKPNTPNVAPPGPWRSFFRRNRRAEIIRELVELALEKGVEIEITDTREGLHVRVPAPE